MSLRPRGYEHPDRSVSFTENGQRYEPSSGRPISELDVTSSPLFGVSTKNEVEEIQVTAEVKSM